MRLLLDVLARRHLRLEKTIYTVEDYREAETDITLLFLLMRRGEDVLPDLREPVQMELDLHAVMHYDARTVADFNADLAEAMAKQ